MKFSLFLLGIISFLLSLISCKNNDTDIPLVSEIVIKPEKGQIDSIYFTYGPGVVRKIEKHWKYLNEGKWLSGTDIWNYDGDSLIIEQRGNEDNIASQIFGGNIYRLKVYYDKSGNITALKDKEGQWNSEYMFDKTDRMVASTFSAKREDGFQSEDTLTYEDDFKIRATHAADSGSYSGFKGSLSNGYWRLIVNEYDKKPYFITDSFVRLFMAIEYDYYWYKYNPTSFERVESREKEESRCKVQAHYSYEENRVTKFTLISKGDELLDNEVIVTSVTVKYQ